MNHKIIYKIQYGSFLYGTNTPTSDQDYKFIYIQSPDEILSNKWVKQYQIDKDNSGYEIRYFLELLNNNNPSAIEMLFATPNFILEKHPVFDIIFNNRAKFLSKKCKLSFGEYAKSQIVKANGLNKLSSWERGGFKKKTPFDFCVIIKTGRYESIEDFIRNGQYDINKIGLTRFENVRDTYAIYYDHENRYKYHGISTEKSNQLRLSQIPKGETPIGTLYYNVDGYSVHCKEYLRYETWVRERNKARYVENVAHGQVYDSKNMMHCQRLLDIATEIATTGNIVFPRENVKELLEIKKGVPNLADLISIATKKIEQMDDLYNISTLPESIDPVFIEELYNYFAQETLKYSNL